MEDWWFGWRCTFCGLGLSSESGLRSHYLAAHQLVYHRNVPPTPSVLVPGGDAERRASRRRLNSRQRRRLNASERGTQHISGDAGNFCHRITTAQTSSTEALGYSSTATSAPQRPARSANSTQTIRGVRDAAVLVRPAMAHRATQAGYIPDDAVGPEFPPGQLSFYQIADAVACHTDWSPGEITAFLSSTAPYRPVTGTDRLRLHGLVLAAVAADYIFARQLLDLLDPRNEGRPHNVAGACLELVRRRGDRLVSMVTLEETAYPPYADVDIYEIDDPYL